METILDRRRYLALFAVATAGGLAGCNDEGDQDGTGDDSESGVESEDTETGDDSESGEESEGDDREEIVEGVSFDIISFAPESAQLGERVSPQITVENPRDTRASGSINYYYAVTRGREPDSEDWEQREVELTIDPGEMTTVELSSFTYEEPVIEYFGTERGEIDHELHIPESKAPILTEANLVTEWNNYGDIEENATETATVGDTIFIAYRYWYWADEGRLSVFRDVEVRDSDGNRVALDTGSGEQLLDQSGWGLLEFAASFDTTDWEPDTYTTRILVEDRDTGGVSNSFEATFELE